MIEAHLKRAQLLIAQSRYEMAADELKQILVTDPNFGHAHTMLSICYANLDKLDEATSEAEQGIHLEPDSPLAYYALANALSLRHRLPEALAAIGEAIRLDPADPDYFGVRAQIYLEQKKWDEALEAANQGLQADPEHVLCNNLRAIALTKLGRKAEAVATLGETLSRRPDSAVTHANQGWSYLERNQPDKAAEHFREALRLDPNQEWAREGIVEALKARNMFYALMLRYFLWMAKLSTQTQVILLIAGWYGSGALSKMTRTHPEWAPVIWTVLAVYIAFALSTWLAVPLFNLVLRFDKFGRYCLSDEQKRASSWVAAGVLLALGWVGYWAGTGTLYSQIGALKFSLILVSLAGVFTCDRGWPRQLMAAYTAGLYGITGLVMWDFANYMTNPASDARLTTFAPVQSWGMMLAPWIANALSAVRVKR